MRVIVRNRMLILLLSTGITSLPCRADEAVSFTWDVLPILSENCFACHGPDDTHRSSDLRLDSREAALAAVRPGHPDDSSLMHRILSVDSDVQMPPPDGQRKPLTAKHQDTLRRWIADGAAWGRHWAFELPQKVPLPRTDRHPVDAFIKSTLQKHGLTLSEPAEFHTLLRRASLAITGLPPSYERLTELQQLIAAGNDPDNVFADAVDQLLSSPHYGERMAMWWLDAARYSDTDGFQGDATRTNWPWRDWVIDAFNANRPFDQFTIEQFAGDLLDQATPEQQLATAFHRNHMTNGEGGRDPEESRVDYVIDRVNSIGTVWLGLTLSCCQCHSHKYDPVSHRDYYSLSAFFNSIDEDGRAGRAAKPYLKYASPYVERAIAESQSLLDQRMQLEQRVLQDAEKPFADWLGDQVSTLVRSAADTQPHSGVSEDSWSFSSWHPLLNAGLESSEGTILVQEPSGDIVATGPNPVQDDYRVVTPIHLDRITGIRLLVLPHSTHSNGSYSRGREGHFVLTDVKVQVRQQGSSQVRDIDVAAAVADVTDDPKKYAGYGDIRHILDDDPRNGWSTRDHDPHQPRTAVLALAEPLQLADDETLVVELRHRSTLGDDSIGRFQVSVTAEAGPAVLSVGRTPLEQLANSGISDVEELPQQLTARLRETFLADYPPWQRARAMLERAQDQFREARDSAEVDVMVLAERPEPRKTHVLVRGVWDQHGEQVNRDVPAEIADWPDQETRSRLGLARWLVSRQNPLTARVLVNHLWQLLFGDGLVRTAEDFGLQGERPLHPQLLDWLAADLMEHDWDIKRMLRLIVTSRTWKQQSVVSAELRLQDPENRLLARGARFRLPSWMLRDAALSAAGLLNPAVGGPPVRPWQPDGVWEEMFMGRFRYVPSDGEAQYRRTVYAFWRRAAAPTFLFDSAQRRVCEVRSVRTNTPLQALTLLNDSSYLEAARGLAEAAVARSVQADMMLNDVARRVLLRDLSDEETGVLLNQFQTALDWYQQHPQDTQQLLLSTDRNGRYGNDGVTRQADPKFQSQLAAMVLVSGLVLNLDEALTHE